MFLLSSIVVAKLSVLLNQEEAKAGVGISFSEELVGD